MGKTVLARFHKDVLEPLEPLDLEEGKKVTVTILDRGQKGYGDNPRFWNSG